MTNQHSIRKNYILNLLLRVTRVIIPLITFPYISRILHPEGLGRVSFAESFVSYLTMIAQFGVPMYGIRACARVRDNRTKLSRTVHELVAINIAMSILSYAVLLVCVLIVPRVRSDWQLFAVFSINIIMRSIGMDWLYEGLEQYSYITIRTLILRLISVALVFILVRRPEHVLLYATTIVVSTAGPEIINIVHSRKYISYSPMGGYNIRKHIRAVFSFFLMAGVTAIYTSLDKVMLGFLAGDAAVGFYSVAIKIKNVLYMCITALVAVLLPRSSYYVEKKMLEVHRKLSNIALNYVFIVSFSLALFFFLYAKETVLFLSGRDYLPAVVPMRFVMAGVAIIGVTNVFTMQILIPLGREKHVLIANAIGAIIDVIVTALMIPLFGVTGAAVGTFVAEIGVFLTVLHYGSVFVSFRKMELFKTLGALLLAGIVGWLFRSCDLPLFWKLLSAGILYFGSFVIALFILREDLMVDATRTIVRRIQKKQGGPV